MNLISLPWRTALLAAVLVTCVGCDQATKQYAIENFKGQPPVSYFGDILIITFAENEGAFLGLGDKLPDGVRFWVFTVANGAIMLLVAGYFLFAKEIDPPSLVALALIVAGGVGNIIDRVRFDVVIDFMNMGIGPLRTGVFNVADMAITGGFLLLLPQLFRSDPKKLESSQPEPAT